jgi:hypothetical protein
LNSLHSGRQTGAAQPSPTPSAAREAVLELKKRVGLFRCVNQFDPTVTIFEIEAESPR